MKRLISWLLALTLIFGLVPMSAMAATDVEIGEGDPDIDVGFEQLLQGYTEANPIDGTVIRCQFRKLDSTLSKLSLEECNQVFSSTVDLCVSHSRQAFTDGIQVGMRLFTELQSGQTIPQQMVVSRPQQPVD